MSNFKYTLPLFLLLCACNSGSKFFLATHKNFSAKNIFSKERNHTTCVQKITYNEWKSIDEEYYQTITVTIHDSLLGRKINIEDSTLLKFDYSFYSVWFAKKEYDAKGWIKISQKNDNEIVLKERIKISTKQPDNKLRLNGKRVCRAIRGDGVR